MTTTNKKVLYFEGAGMSYNSSTSDIGNHRIRTAFRNNNNQSIYLEVSNHEFTDNKKQTEWRISVDHLFYIQDNPKDKIYIERDLPSIKECSKQAITTWINNHFNCSFDDIEVLSFFSGYRVHGNNQDYNLIDDFKVDKDKTLKREVAYSKVDKYYKEKLNSKYSKISLLEMDDNTITIRCHDSDQAMKKAGLTERIQVITI